MSGIETGLAIAGVTAPIVGGIFDYLASGKELASAKKDRDLQLRLFRTQQREATRQFEAGQDLSREQIAEGARQFDISTGLQKQQFEENKMLSRTDRRMNAVNSLMAALNSRQGVMSNMAEIARRRR